MKLDGVVISKDNLLWAVQVIGYLLIPILFGWAIRLQAEVARLKESSMTQAVTTRLEVKRLDSSDSDLARRLDSIDTRLDDIAHDIKELIKRVQ